MNVRGQGASPIESDPIDQAADSLPVITRGRRSIARINHLAPIDYRYRYFPEVSAISSPRSFWVRQGPAFFALLLRLVCFLSLSSACSRPRPHPRNEPHLNAWAGPSSFLRSRRVLGLRCRYCQRWPR